MTWPTASLGSLVTTYGGGTPSMSKPEYFGGSIPWVTPKDMKAREIVGSQARLTDAGVANSPTRLIPSNSVLLVVRSGVLKHRLPVGITRVPVTVNQDMKALVPSSALDAEYLSRLLDAWSPRVLGWVRATTADNFPISRLHDLEIPLPPLDQQRRIARMLGAADVLRTKAKLVLARLPLLIESFFEDLFGETVSNPLGWPMRTIADVAIAQGGLQVTTARASYPIETPYLRVANVHRNRLDLDELKPLRVTAAELERCALEPGDLLIVEGHGNTSEIGRAALWDGSVPGCVHQNHLIRARFDQEQVLPLYGASYVNSPGGRRHLLRSAKTTSGLNTITVSDVRRTPIAVPPLAKQQEFTERVAAIETQQDTQWAQLRLVEALFASLQSRAFVGEI